MEKVTMILSGLALLAAILCLILILQEKKRNQKRNADFVNYIDEECKAAAKYVNEVRDSILNEVSGRFTNEELGLWEELNRRFDDISGKMEEIDSSIASYDEELPGIKRNVADLMKGVVPDYNEALAAKNSVDEFNRGLSAIMGFDPLEAVRKSRQERTHGGRVE